MYAVGWPGFINGGGRVGKSVGAEPPAAGGKRVWGRAPIAGRFFAIFL